MDAVIGIDVGTGSARTGVFTLAGELLSSVSVPIKMWKSGDFVEQSSADIWSAICEATRQALAGSEFTAKDICGIGFDATCSLVCLDSEGAPVTVSPDGDDARNVIVWMDHRATEQATRINSGDHRVLEYVGGKISPEMQTPKLLWLKEKLPISWARTAQFFDLPDFLTWRATGETSRSLCSTVCKWTYLGHESRWDANFFKGIGLGELADENFVRIGQNILPMGKALGDGLSVQAAAELGLLAGTPVAASIIDAHAGALGVIGASLDGEAVNSDELERRLALICGTSSCHMAVSLKPRNIDGIWGPYFSAMVPGMWLNEGGQSTSGALIDHVIKNHGCGKQAEAAAKAKGITIYQYLNERLDELASGVEFPAELTKDFHVLPYFHGNRSPRANPELRGMFVGLNMENSIDDLAVRYLAVIQAIAYGTKHIVDSMNDSGYAIDRIFACGGDCKNPIFLREHADILGCDIVLAREPEAVLLGAATLGALAGRAYGDLPAAMAAMNHAGEIIAPGSAPCHSYHNKKYEVFLKMYEDFVGYKQMMS